MHIGLFIQSSARPTLSARCAVARTTGQIARSWVCTSRTCPSPVYQPGEPSVTRGLSRQALGQQAGHVVQAGQRFEAARPCALRDGGLLVGESGIELAGDPVDNVFRR